MRFLSQGVGHRVPLRPSDLLPFEDRTVAMSCQSLNADQELQHRKPATVISEEMKGGLRSTD